MELESSSERQERRQHLGHDGRMARCTWVRGRTITKTAGGGEAAECAGATAVGALTQRLLEDV